MSKEYQYMPGTHYDYFGNKINVNSHIEQGCGCSSGCTGTSANCNQSGSNCSCRKDPCGCSITLQSDCVKYLGPETENLKNNKTLTNILKDLEEHCPCKTYLFGDGLKVTETSLGTLVEIDEEYICNLINGCSNKG